MRWRRDVDWHLPAGTERPAVVEDSERGFELVLGWAVRRHDLDESKEESAVFVDGPLWSHDWYWCRGCGAGSMSDFLLLCLSLLESVGCGGADCEKLF